MRTNLWLLSAAACAAATLTTADAGACSPYDAGVYLMQWVADGDEDVPRNTHIALTIQEEGTQAEIQIIGPDGALPTQITRHAFGSSALGAYYLVAPEQLLDPHTNYEIAVTTMTYWDGPVEQRYHFTTGDHLDTTSPPSLGDLGYFVHQYPRVGEECSPNETNRAYVVFPPENTGPQPLLYSIEISPQQSGESVNPSYSQYFYSFEYLDSIRSRFIIRVLDTDDFPCIRVTAEDHLGQRASSELICVPSGCWETDDKQSFPGLFLPRDWEGSPDCDLLLPDPAPEEEPTPEQPAPGEEPAPTTQAPLDGDAVACQAHAPSGRRHPRAAGLLASLALLAGLVARR